MSRSEPAPRAAELPRALGTNAVLVLTLAALSPAASLFVTGAAILHLAGTGAAFAVIGGGGAVLISSALYAEFGAAFPHAGGVYHGIIATLGPRAGAAALALGAVTAPALLAFSSLGLAAYARTLGLQLPLGTVAVAAIAFTALMAMLRLRIGLWLTGTLLAVELLVIGVLTVACWTRPARTIGEVLSHPVVAAPHGALIATPPLALLIGTIAAAYACSGASLAINFAEDLAGDRHRIGGLVRRAGIASVILVAVPLIGLTLAIPDLASVLKAEAPIAASLHMMFGERSANLLGAVIVIAILDHLGGAMLAYSRFLFAAARTLGGIVAPLARTDARTQVPIYATIALGCVSAGLTMLGQRTLLVLISGELITPALMIAAVIVVRRHQTVRKPRRLNVLLPAVGLCILLLFAVATLMDNSGRQSLVLLSIIAVTAALTLAEPIRRSAAV